MTEKTKRLISCISAIEEMAGGTLSLLHLPLESAGVDNTKELPEVRFNVRMHITERKLGRQASAEQYFVFPVQTGPLTQSLITRSKKDAQNHILRMPYSLEMRKAASSPCSHPKILGSKTGAV